MKYWVGSTNAFEVTVINLFTDKPTLDPGVLAN